MFGDLMFGQIVEFDPKSGIGRIEGVDGKKLSFHTSEYSDLTVLRSARKKDDGPEVYWTNISQNDPVPYDSLRPAVGVVYAAFGKYASPWGLAERYGDEMEVLNQLVSAENYWAPPKFHTYSLGPSQGWLHYSRSVYQPGIEEVPVEDNTHYLVLKKDGMVSPGRFAEPHEDGTYSHNRELGHESGGVTEPIYGLIPSEAEDGFYYWGPETNGWETCSRVHLFYFDQFAQEKEGVGLVTDETQTLVTFASGYPISLLAGYDYEDLPVVDLRNV